MTSHYMSCVVNSTFDPVFQGLAESFGQTYSKQFGDTGKARIGIILGEKYFWRVNSDVAVLIVLTAHSSEETNLEVMSCAGGTGWMGISYAAHSAYVHNVKKFLTDSGFHIESEKEIPNFEHSPEGKSFLKRCRRCNAEIPITTDECPHCGTLQS